MPQIGEILGKTRIYFESVWLQITFFSKATNTDHFERNVLKELKPKLKQTFKPA